MRRRLERSVINMAAVESPARGEWIPGLLFCLTYAPGALPATLPPQIGQYLGFQNMA